MLWLPGCLEPRHILNTGSSQLFDWCMTIFGMDVRLSNPVTLAFETTFRSGELGDPKLEITVGWTVRWQRARNRNP